ncbi:hypothetical protein DOT_5001 [Desulfosporosinus sp. OT]|nr:hypothetical protein DOT_5001 [Desulfosporosinus sp. OT]
MRRPTAMTQTGRLRLEHRPKTLSSQVLALLAGWQGAVMA